MPSSREDREAKEAKKLAAKERREKRNRRKAEKAEKEKLIQKSNDQECIIHSFETNQVLPSKTNKSGSISLASIPQDELVSIICYLSARDVGAMILTCRTINSALTEGREQHLLCRLGENYGLNQSAIRKLLADSQKNPPKNRLVSKRLRKIINTSADTYPSFARFIEETACGLAFQNYRDSSGGGKQKMPSYVEGRIVSVSPEHSLSRCGGDSRAGAGGSGCASWGVGKRGQLGNGNRDDSKSPSPITGGLGAKIRIVQVSAGGGLVRVAHSLLLTDLGQVLSFGTAMYGQLGHGFNSGKTLRDVYRPKFIEGLRHVRCTYVSAGELHSAAVTEDGDLYTWGDNFCGQLGIGNKRPKVEPEQVTLGGLEDECVHFVSCGHRHTIVVTEDWECFTFGLGHYGALGRSYTPFQYTVNIEGEEVAGIVDPEDRSVENIVNQQEQNYANVEENIITAEMREHLDLLGNLTLDDPSDQCYPVRLDSLDDISIVSASAGHRHSILLDNEGGVYTFGCGRNGKLGHGENTREDFPLKVLGLDNIIQVSAGVDSSMALSRCGDVFSWGKATNGVIGHNHSGDISLPLRVPIPQKVLSVDCGYVHSLVVGIDGTIFQCGSVGIDGHDDGADELSLGGAPLLLPDFNVWHRTPEPKEAIKKEKWKKYGKYELKGRSKVMAEETSGWNGR